MIERRILVVEDEALMSSLLANVLTSVGFTVEVAANVVQARQKVDSFDPDAVLLDISLGSGPTGLDLGYVLHHQRPDVALIFLTKHPDERTLGVEKQGLPPNCGFLRKNMVQDTSYLLDAIETVLAEHAREVRHDATVDNPLGSLSAQQIDALRLMAMGYTNARIAQIKGASESSVERWVAGIFKGLGIDASGEFNPRVEAVRRFVAAAGLPER